MIPCEVEPCNDSASQGITRRIASHDIVTKDRAGTGATLLPVDQGYLNVMQQLLLENLPKRCWLLKLITSSIHHHLEVNESLVQHGTRV